MRGLQGSGICVRVEQAQGTEKEIFPSAIADEKAEAFVSLTHLLRSDFYSRVPSWGLICRCRAGQQGTGLNCGTAPSHVILAMRWRSSKDGRGGAWIFARDTDWWRAFRHPRNLGKTSRLTRFQTCFVSGTPSRVSRCAITDLRGRLAGRLWRVLSKASFATRGPSDCVTKAQSICVKTLSRSTFPKRLRA